LKYLLIYEAADDVLEQAPLHAAGHNAAWQRFHESGELVMIGPYSDASGALGVFTNRAAAEAMAATDPFVTEGVVRSWRIVEWREILQPEG